MSVIQNSTPISKSNSDTAFNPKSKLDKDAFMKLFLKQLEMQDPTKPMDTDKMLEQTASLSTMEMNQNMKQSLDDLKNTLLKTDKMNTISAIGKMGDTKERYINVKDNDTSKSFELYFKDDIKNGQVEIRDKQGNIIKTFKLDPHSKGILSFDWDLKDDNGKKVPANTYEITATYKNNQDEELKTALGAYPIESIKFENGQTLAKLGSQYVPFDKIKEIYE